jgi:hypothetical protein
MNVAKVGILITTFVLVLGVVVEGLAEMVDALEVARVSEWRWEVEEVVEQEDDGNDGEENVSGAALVGVRRLMSNGRMVFVKVFVVSE